MFGMCFKNTTAHDTLQATVSPKLKDTNKPACHDVFIAMQEKLQDDKFDVRLVFSDEATCHVNLIILSFCTDC